MYKLRIVVMKMTWSAWQMKKDTVIIKTAPWKLLTNSSEIQDNASMQRVHTSENSHDDLSVLKVKISRHV